MIPPSLVLLLLGDAMMRAHTEAVNVTRAAVRIVNTQDVMRAALLPGLAVLVAALGLAAWRARATGHAPCRRRSVAAAAMQAAGAAVVIVVLLGAVATGRLYAVEAAATGGAAAPGLGRVHASPRPRPCSAPCSATR